MRNERKKERKLSTQAAAKVDSWCLGCDWCLSVCTPSACHLREIQLAPTSLIRIRPWWLNFENIEKEWQRWSFFVNGAANHWCSVSMRCVNVVQPINCNARYGTRPAAASSACVLTQKVPCNEKKKTRNKTKKNEKLLLQHQHRTVATVTGGRLQRAHTIKLFSVLNNFNDMQSSNAEQRCEQIDISNGTLFLSPICWHCTLFFFLVVLLLFYDKVARSRVASKR